MRLKNFVTVSFGLLLSLKAMADDKDIYSQKMASIETNKKAVSDVKNSYQVNTGYRINDFYAFDATAINPTKAPSNIFTSNIDPHSVRHMRDAAFDEKYAFSAGLEISRGL
ncbi:hypothetical protein [Pseudomonas sp. NFX15]|uniref:hypothetical protein n=1 Tax=Pseudomonas sp. NFX15 TaxID=2816958 RepID=UPI003B8DD96E